MFDSNSLREEPINDEVKFKGILIDVHHMQVRLPNGRIAMREAVRHKGAAAIVPVDEEGNVYLVTQHRVVVDEMMLEIPAGKLDTANEDPCACAIRELSEETGLVATHITPLMSAITTPGFCTEKIGLYLATGLSQRSAHLDQDEFLSVSKMPLTEAVAMVMRGEIHDAKTALGLLMAEKALANSHA